MAGAKPPKTSCLVPVSTLSVDSKIMELKLIAFLNRDQTLNSNLGCCSKQRRKLKQQPRLLFRHLGLVFGLCYRDLIMQVAILST